MDLRRTLNRFRGAYYFFNLLSPGIKPFKAYLNWLLSNWEMRRRARKVGARPLKLTFEPSSACQLRCPLCPTGLRILERSPKFASPEMFSRLLDEVGDYVFFIDFYNWGEPLLSPHLEELVRIASERRISTTVSTNFSLKVSDDRLRKLVRAGLNHLIISLDGASAESYTQYRRGGDFDLILENTRRLVAIRNEEASSTPYITWQFLILRFNEHEFDQAQSMARDLGVDRLWFTKASLDENEYPLPDKDRAVVRSWVPSNPSHTFYDPRDVGLSLSAPLRRKEDGRRNRCDWLYITSAVNSDGSVAPCCAVYTADGIFGSLGSNGEASYMETVNNPVFIAARDTFANRTGQTPDVVCGRCTLTSLMDYSRGINRWIAVMTIVKLAYYAMNTVSRLLGKRHKPAKPGLKIKWPD